MSASHRFGPSKAILAHNRGTAPFPLSKKGVARRNLVCDIWLTGGSTNGAEKEPQDWGALVADGRKELINFKRCLFLRHVWHVSEVVANIFTQRHFSSFHISFLRFYSLRTATRHPLTFPNWGYFRWMNRHWGMRCHWGSIRYNSVSFHARLITDEFRKRFASHAFGPRKAMLTHKRRTTISCPFKNRPTWWNFFLDVWLAGRGIHENRERASGSPNNFAWFFLMISRRTDA